MRRLWFRRKTYGWGWVPSSWEGWLVTLVFLGVIVKNFLRIDRAQHSVSDTLINFVPETIILVLVLILICYLTDEKPKWQWGNDEDKTEQERKS